MKNSFLTIVVILVLTAGNAVAQHFEWVRGYAPGNQASIVGSVTDSLGNLYILGSINFNTCWENEVPFLSIVNQSKQADHGVIVAKISPEGNMLWHKIVYGNGGINTPHDIKLVGDSSFACLITMPLATNYHYLFYLDTLVLPSGLNNDNPWPNYPMCNKHMNYSTCLALVTFDFSGNAIEQHFLQKTFLDSEFNDIVSHNSLQNDTLPCYVNMEITHPSFAFDNEGNIFISRWAFDYAIPDYSVENGSIRAIKFWCDQREVGCVSADSSRSTTPQLLKFAPHFDTLLDSKYVFQTAASGINCARTHLEIDKDNNIYAIIQNDPILNHTATVGLDTVNGIFFKVNDKWHAEKYFTIRYTPQLVPESVIMIEDTITDTLSFQAKIFSIIEAITFDYDSNYVIMACSPRKNIIGYPDINTDNSYFKINGTPTNLHGNTCIVVFDRNNMKLKNYGQLVTTSGCSFLLGRASGNIACSKNRIFVQSLYRDSIVFPDQSYTTSHNPSPGICLGVFDYNCNLIEGIDYQSCSSTNQPGPINIYDSSLYLINRLSSDAAFGSILTPSRGSYFACIAKYNDPAFSRTYVRPRDTTVCVTVEEEELTVVRYPNPTTGRLTIDMKDRPLREAWVAAMDGIAEPLPVTPLGGGRYAADLSARPDGTYILVLVADDHRAYRATVILQR